MNIVNTISILVTNLTYIVIFISFRFWFGGIGRRCGRLAVFLIAKVFAVQLVADSKAYGGIRSALLGVLQADRRFRAVLLYKTVPEIAEGCQLTPQMS